MNILITGGCGFIGSNLTDKLINLNHKVSVIDNLFTGKKENLNSKAILYQEDILSKDILNIKNLNIVIHLAAIPRIIPSFKNEKKVLNVNSNGTLRILELAKINNAYFIYAASSTYHNGIYNNPYAYSKWLGEQHCKYYNNLYNLQYSIVRLFNVYGPNQIEEGLYATMMGVFEKRKRENLSLIIRGNGEQRRDFIHVNDVCNAIINIINNKYNNQTFEIGTGKNYSINEIAKLFKSNYIYEPIKENSENRNTLAKINLPNWESEINIDNYIINKFYQKS